jgi:hypothetical protein
VTLGIFTASIVECPGGKPRRAYELFGRWSRCRTFAFGRTAMWPRSVQRRGGPIANPLNSTILKRPLSNESLPQAAATAAYGDSGQSVESV